MLAALEARVGPRASSARSSSRSPAASTRRSSPRSRYRALGDNARAVTAVSPPSRSGELDGAQRVARPHRHRATRSSARTSSPAPATAPTAATAATSARPSSTTRSPRATPGVTLLSGANQDDQGDWRPGLKSGRRARRRPPADRRHQGAGPRARRELCSSRAPRSPPRRASRRRIPYGTAGRPRDARPDRPRRAGRHERSASRSSESATSAPSAASRSTTRTARSRQRTTRSSRRSSGAGYTHAMIDERPFRSGRLNVEPARPAASR